MTVWPLVTIVIPTHNRRSSLARCLQSLVQQHCEPGMFEVVVAANACSDDTVDWARDFSAPYRIRVLDLPAAGAAAARNAGAEIARGTLLIFLDDDIEAAPEFVAAHLDAHRIRDEAPFELPLRVAIGYLPAALQPEADYFAIALRGWWEAMFDRVRAPHHRFGHGDLLSGNFSIPRARFLQLDGFDTRYRCHEDYELGYRLVCAGASFVFAEHAAGQHADQTRLGRACWRKREEGRADAQLARSHPELRPALPLANRTTIKQRALRLLAFRAPRLGEDLVALLERVLTIMERVGARATWYRVVYAIFDYWYERGVADATGSLEALRSSIADAWADPRLTASGIHVDVSDLAHAEEVLDRERPEAATLSIGARTFARIPYEPGSEPLAGRHLRPLLIHIWHRAYVRALVAENRIAILSDQDGHAPHPVRVNRSNASEQRLTAIRIRSPLSDRSEHSRRITESASDPTPAAGSSFTR